MILGPLAPWAPGGRTCRPSPRAGPGPTLPFRGPMSEPEIMGPLD